METEVKTFWYIGLSQEDGSTLFYNEMNRNWSRWRREASAWLAKWVAVDHLKNNIERKNVPANAKAIGIRQTVEEVK